jgi:hypothetical protein
VCAGKIPFGKKAKRQKGKKAKWINVKKEHLLVCDYYKYALA